MQSHEAMHSIEDAHSKKYPSNVTFISLSASTLHTILSPPKTIASSLEKFVSWASRESY
jgi:hypothetical protein